MNSRTQAVLRYAPQTPGKMDTIQLCSQPLDNAKVIKRAKRAGAQFQSSFLLFVRALDEIRIDCPVQEKKWSKDVKMWRCIAVTPRQVRRPALRIGLSDRK